MKKLRVSMICADLKNKKLLIPAELIKKTSVLKSGEASLFFKYTNRYPDFEIVII